MGALPPISPTIKLTLYLPSKFPSDSRYSPSTLYRLTRVMDDSPQATGVQDALIGDLLLGLGIENPLALSREESALSRSREQWRMVVSDLNRPRVCGS